MIAQPLLLEPASLGLQKVTDSTEAYSKTVPAGALPWASLDSIGGKTVVWNQIFPSRAVSVTGTNFTATRTASGEFVVTCSDTASNAGGDNWLSFTASTFVVGHKYVFLSSDSRFKGNLKRYLIETDSIFEVSTASFNNFTVRFTNIPAGTYNFYIYLVDLTLMFGTGNEPATVAEFKAMFPSIDPEYNEGELMSAGGTEVESEGRNLLNMVPFRCRGGFYNLTVGTVIERNTPTTVITENNGVFTYQVNSWEGCVFIAPMKPNTYYYRTFTCTASGGMRSSTYILDANFKVLAVSNSTENPASWSGRTTTTLSNAAWYAFAVGSNAASTVTITTPQFELGSTATAYTPYFSRTLPIPAALQALPGYGWSAGTVYNYVDYARKVYVQRVGSVNLGTLTWTMQSDSISDYFRAYFSGVKYPTQAGVVANAVCAIYPTTTSSNVYNKSVAIGWSSMTTTTIPIYVRDTSYTDAATFKSAMSGVMLYYELATPVETDISSLLTDSMIEVEPGGTLTFKNQHGDDWRVPVPTEIMYTMRR